MNRKQLAGVLFATLAIALPFPSFAQSSSASTNRLVIHADQPGATINRHLYGQFSLQFCSPVGTEAAFQYDD